MRIILDTMGSDNGAEEFVKAALLAIEELDIDIVLVGCEDELKALLEKHDKDKLYEKNITILPTSEVVTMEDDPVAVIKQKPDSSMLKALRYLADNKGDAVVSAGNTGALLTMATLVVKRIKGIRRAALAPVVPTANGCAILIDSGANVDCTPEYLYQFALMGSFYAENALGIKKTRVGLLNNGTESHKGDDLHREAYKLLTEAHENKKINFVGNIEGRDGPLGAADVIVADGFSGNIYLKTMEGVGLFFSREIKKMFMSSKRGKVSGLMLKRKIGEFKSKIDYNEAGGAPLLGVRKPVIKAHGSAKATALCNAIVQAIDYIDSGMTIKLSNTLGGGEQSEE